MSLKNLAYLHGNLVIISELLPNEAEFLVKKLNSSGIDASYYYRKALWFQRITIDNGNEELLQKVKSII